MYADDLKVCQNLMDMDDLASFQHNLNSIWKWASDWQLPIAIKKCSILDFGKCVLDPEQSYLYLNGNRLPIGESVTDLGILFSSKLSYSEHITSIVGRAKQRSNLIFRCFVAAEIFYLLKGYICYVRPIVEYCSQVWSPTKLSDIERLESVQRSFTKRLPGLRSMTYKDRLTHLNLCSLEERRLKHDLTFLFNSLHNFNNINPTQIGLTISTATTRGHAYKLTINHSSVSARSNFFSNRIAHAWNSLPEFAAYSTSTVQFKSQIEKVDFTPFLVQSFD
jgi:hypothetical protein